MGKRLTLILGGARSGKSSYAQNLAGELGARVLFVATALAFDEEMTVRIAAHQAGRPAGWRTLEAPSEVGKAIRAGDGQEQVLLLDCVTLLANNVILALPDAEDSIAAQEALDAEMDALLAAYAGSSSEWIIVSNEVGLGLVPATPLGRVYRDVLGRANQKLAQAADRVIFMVAGLPMIVK
jgi:adenosylcobinamide kinase/adenosylcobinamide-phosphate guanylyltransferase